MTKTRKTQLLVVLAMIFALAFVFGALSQVTFAHAAEVSATADYSSYFAGGSGTSTDPYLISNATQLNNIRYTAKSYLEGDVIEECFKLTNNISLSGTWTPIPADFDGVLDGAGYYIEHLKIALSEDYSHFGLFAYVYHGTVKNLKFTDVTITSPIPVSYPFVGVIAGSNEGTITNCIVYNGKINVDITYSWVGGIVGLNSAAGTISNCENAATISAGQNTGGIAGSNSKHATISYCTNSGTLNGPGNVGGIARINDDYATISHCTNGGTLNGPGNVGGIAGINGNYAAISNCNNDGLVNGPGNVGGIAGSNKNYATITDCDNRHEIYGTGNVAGIAGLNTDYAGVITCNNRAQITYYFDTSSGCAAGIVGKNEGSAEVFRCTNHSDIVYGSPEDKNNKNIQPCMAQIVGWKVGGNVSDAATYCQGKVYFDNLKNPLFGTNQHKYCSNGAIGR